MASAHNSTGSQIATGARPPGAVSLFNASDIQLYKQQMYSNFINNYSPVYTPNHANRASFAYTFMTGPGTASGRAIANPTHVPLTPAPALQQAAVIKHTNNPYARPISAQDLIAPDGVIPGKGSLTSALTFGSNSSISRVGFIPIVVIDGRIFGET